jgi:hypothetical protein
VLIAIGEDANGDNLAAIIDRVCLGHVDGRQGDERVHVGDRPMLPQQADRVARTRTAHYLILRIHHVRERARLLQDEFRYFGIDSPTGHRWYNFDPASYLHCGALLLVEDGEGTDASWLDLALLLWLGQIGE